jgi:hypothetical protein
MNTLVASGAPPSAAAPVVAKGSVQEAVAAIEATERTAAAAVRTYGQF